VALGRAPPQSAPSQTPLFFGSLAVAFIAIFLPWFSVTGGAAAVAVSIALFIGYENTIPSQVDIRVDLLFLVPLMVAAAISLVVAVMTRTRAGARSRSRRRL
jgi:hypothetical protein